MKAFGFFGSTVNQASSVKSRSKEVGGGRTHVVCLGKQDPVGPDFDQAVELPSGRAPRRLKWKVWDGISTKDPVAGGGTPPPARPPAYPAETFEFVLEGLGVIELARRRQSGDCARILPASVSLASVTC